MTTTYDLDTRKRMTAEASGTVVIYLLTFTHPELPDPIRLSSDMTKRLSLSPLYYGTISRGQTFLWLPMLVTVPGDDEQSAPEINLLLDAVDRSIFPYLRASQTPATLKLEWVLETSPDDVEGTFSSFTVVSAPYDEGQATLVLSQESFWAENWPAGHMTPISFPGLHP